MQKHFYPAVFHQEQDGFTVTFHGLEGCVTEGDTLEEAYEMAIDALGLYMQNQDGTFAFPVASNPKDIHVNDDEFVVLIEFDEAEYRKMHDNKAVKKTLTIPSWLNSAAERNNINFSAILKEALIDRLGL